MPLTLKDFFKQNLQVQINNLTSASFTHALLKKKENLKT